jgi:hypothetical protein
MLRISFDFMTRRIKQFAFETFIQHKRDARRMRTAEEVAEARKKAEFEKQFIPQQIFGPGYVSRVLAGDSRQVRRRRERILAFAEITNKYLGEPRRIRRSMAFDLIRNRAKAKAA